MYAIEMLFSEGIESYIKKKWEELSFSNITSSIYDIENIRPHVTLAVYEDIEDITNFKSDFVKYFNDTDSLEELIFVDVGVFPTTGTVFIKPTITRKLIDFHEKYHSEFSKYSKHSNEYYLPNNWNPHCTLAINLNQEEVIKTIMCILEDFKPINGMVTEIGLVHIIHDGVKFVSSDTIISRKLGDVSSV